jgi:hypothetical protein
MPDGTTTVTPRAPWAFFIITAIVYYTDLMLRYGTAIWTHPTVWAIMVLPYWWLWAWARKLPALTHLGEKSILTTAIFAYFWGPFWSVLPHYTGKILLIDKVAAIMLFAAPVWPAVILFKGEYQGRLLKWVSGSYTIFWLVLALFSLMPQIQTYASTEYGVLQGSLTPGQALSYALETTWTATKNLIKTAAGLPARFTEEIERSLRIASGDIYTGRVDSGARKRLGVYIENFRPSQVAFEPGTPVTTYSLLKAETLDAPLDINIKCEAEQAGFVSDVSSVAAKTGLVEQAKTTPASKILPQSAFNVLSSDQYDIDCIWDSNALQAGTSYNLRLTADFDFTTRAYQKTYMMDRDRLREYRKQNIDPLASAQDKSPVAIYTSGPVRIAMSIGNQPIPVGQPGDALPIWGINIQNAWEGRILMLTNAFFQIPKGIEIADTGGTKLAKTDCSALPLEEQSACDNQLVDVYALSAEELELPGYKNLTAKDIRLYLKAASPEAILGKAPIAVQNFKTSVQYKYQLERSTTSVIKKQVQVQ